VIYQTESKLQGWRAVAVAAGGTEHLLFVGRSSTQVRTGYGTAFRELLEADERKRVRHVSLQHWNGVADEGRWVEHSRLSVPAAPKAARRRVALSAST
jgi:hypothetical protein